MKISNTNRKDAGGTTNLNSAPRGVKGNAKAIPTTPRLLKSKGLLGALFQNGTLVVLITNITKV